MAHRILSTRSAVLLRSRLARYDRAATGVSGVMIPLDSDEYLLIVTPTTVEWEAMRSKMIRPRKVDGEVALVQGTIGAAHVLCASPGKGSGFTAALTMQLLERYRIRYVFPSRCRRRPSQRRARRSRRTDRNRRS